MPELHYRDGGTWRKARELYYRDGGAWRKIKEAWYRDGGVWRKVFSGDGPVSLFDGSLIGYQRNGATSTAAITFETDGSVSESGVAFRVSGLAPGVIWHSPVTPGIGASYWIQANGGAWQQLSTARTFSVAQASPGSNSQNFLINISASAGGAILATGTVTLEADRI